MVTQLYGDFLCQVIGQTKAFRCVNYLDRRIFGTNVKVEARKWLIMGPTTVLVVPTKDVSYTLLVSNDIL
jgi:hypothetical protein